MQGAANIENNPMQSDPRSDGEKHLHRRCAVAVINLAAVIEDTIPIIAGLIAASGGAAPSPVLVLRRRRQHRVELDGCLPLFDAQ